MKFTLSQLAVVVGATWHGSDVVLHHISIDSRTVKPDSLFIALKGERFDGHDFVAQAAALGAKALLVEHAVDSPLPQLVVKSVHQALGQLAAFQRQACDIPVIGVTGSCGKTTTKALIASILTQSGRALATEGTLNNDIGVPLTLFNLSYKHDYAVIEMGANHPGEIAYLTRIAQPSIGVITNAAPVHLEGFGSVEGVAQAKAELYQHLPVDGVAILNIDDEKQSYWRSVIGARTYVTYGLNPSADVYATEVRLDEQGCSHFILHHGGEHIEIHLPLLGLHNVHNALAAAAVGFSLNLPLKTIRKGLQKAENVAKRSHRLPGLHGATLIDDSYNANPTAFKVAIDLLTRLQHHGERLLIMGDMGELGPEAARFHAEVGHAAKKAGIDRLLTVGPLSAHATTAFGAGAEHFEHQEALLAKIKPELNSRLLILIKGSRSARMEGIVNALAANPKPSAH